ncbi:MAG: EAL domain-containing protein [Oscillospiraceae bacterium]
MAMLRKILVVDDSAVNRQILCKILDNDYETTQAENGKQALEILNKNPESFSLVLLDIVMPIMDGYEFLRQRKKSVALSDIPVIVATKMEGEEGEVEALAGGASDYILKPYKPEIIKHRIANIIELRETSVFANTIERDMLTGLYTKEAFYARAAELIFRNPTSNYDIISLDVENFKLVNDAYGEAEGDKLLCFIADLLKHIIRSTSGCSGRLSGDVFAAIIPRNVLNYEKDLVEYFANVLNKYPLNLRISIKLGIYQPADTNLSVRALCDRAKMATESIKGKYGIYHAYYDEGFGGKIQAELEMASQMKSALLNGDFKVYCQPKFDLLTEELVGAEALVRWQHPEKGIIPPDEFIPFFERNGFIADLDIYVWECTCKKLSEWLGSGGKPFPISVNVSRVDIYNPNLPKLMFSIARKYHISPDLLHIEITETAYTENQQQLIQAVNQFKQYGFIIEMDDFGSGYSSLTMLNDVPVDIIKMDMNFLKSKNTIKKGSSILGFIINLSNELNLPVIAEGIETLEDLTFLRSLGCQYGQGYYYSKPLPFLEFCELLEITKIQDYCPFKSARTLSPIKSETHTNTQEEFYESVYNTVPCGIAGFTILEHKLISCNSFFAKQLAYPAGSLPNPCLPLKKIISARSRRALCAELNRLENEQSTENSSERFVDVELICNDRSRRWVVAAPQRIFRKGTDIIQIVFFNLTSNTAEALDYCGLKSIIENIPCGVLKYRVGGLGVFEFASDSLFKIIGYSRDEFCDKYFNRLENFLFEIGAPRECNCIFNQLENGIPDYHDYNVMTKFGDKRRLFTVTQSVSDENGCHWHYVIVIDITDFNNSRASVRTIQEKYESLFPNSQNIIFERDMSSGKITCTENFKEKFGYWPGEGAAAQALGGFFIHPHDGNRFKLSYRQLENGASFSECDVRMRCANGKYIWCKISSTAIQDSIAKSQKMVGAIIDINNQKLLMEEACTDSLTGLLNRKHFELEIKALMKTRKGVGAFIMMDIDDFKLVNDQKGHREGDIILKNVAAILKKVFRKDDLLARIGGDEFSVFSPDIPSNDLPLMLLEQVKQLLRDKLDITCSFGIAFSPECGSEFETLYQNADAAMYKIKNTVKDGTCVSCGE